MKIRRQISYSVVERSSTALLGESIEKRIGEGWKLQRGVSCMFIPQTGDHPDWGCNARGREVFLQAVIKKESWLSWIKRLMGRGDL